MSKLLFVLVLGICSTASSSAEADVSFSYTLQHTAAEQAVDPVYGVSLESTVYAVDLALQHINNNSTLLPAINLTYEQVNSVQCDRQDSVASFGILGRSRSCAGGGLYPPSMSTQVLFTAGVTRDSGEADAGTGLYRLHPTADTYTRAVVALVEQFGWQRLSVLTSAGHFFDQVKEGISAAVNTTISLIETQNDTDQIFPSDVRIFFLNMDTEGTIETMCQAYLSDKHFPSYVWMTYSRDYLSLLPSIEGGSSCSAQQLAAFLDGTLALHSAPVGSYQHDVLLEQGLQVARDKNFSQLAYFAYDAVLSIARALNDSLSELPDTATMAECGPIEEAISGNNGSAISCHLSHSLRNVSFFGTTGVVSFDESGDRLQNVIGVTQFREGVQFPQEVLVATVTVTLFESAEFNFMEGENETTIFRGPIPPDGTPIKMAQVLPLALIITYYIITSVGILFTIVCFLFTIFYRNKKIVKLTSPNLNYFIIVGALLIFISVYFRLLPSRSIVYAEFLCSFQVFATCLGYVLCFAPVLMKMWRVYYIFHNPHPGKKVVRDWYLFVGVSIIVGIILAFISLGTAIPQTRPFPTPVTDEERPTGQTEDGITINFCVFECYGDSGTIPLVWAGISFVYLVVLQVAAFILAVLTRKVTIKVLNDAKWMAVIIYTTSGVLLVLGIVTFALTSYLIVTEALFSGGIMLATLVFLVCQFVPKMVFQYKDPEGETIFTTTKEHTHTGDRSLTPSPILPRRSQTHSFLSRAEAYIQPLPPRSQSHSQPRIRNQNGDLLPSKNGIKIGDITIRTLDFDSNSDSEDKLEDQVGYQAPSLAAETESGVPVTRLSTKEDSTLSDEASGKEEAPLPPAESRLKESLLMSNGVKDVSTSQPEDQTSHRTLSLAECGLLQSQLDGDESSNLTGRDLSSQQPKDERGYQALSLAESGLVQSTVESSEAVKTSNLTEITSSKLDDGTVCEAQSPAVDTHSEIAHESSTVNDNKLSTQPQDRTSFQARTNTHSELAQSQHKYSMEDESSNQPKDHSSSQVSPTSETHSEAALASPQEEGTSHSVLTGNGVTGNGLSNNYHSTSNNVCDNE